MTYGKHVCKHESLWLTPLTLEHKLFQTLASGRSCSPSGPKLSRNKTSFFLLAAGLIIKAGQPYWNKLSSHRHRLNALHSRTSFGLLSHIYIWTFLHKLYSYFIIKTDILYIFFSYIYCLAFYFINIILECCLFVFIFYFITMNAPKADSEELLIYTSNMTNWPILIPIFTLIFWLFLPPKHWCLESPVEKPSSRLAFCQSNHCTFL